MCEVSSFRLKELYDLIPKFVSVQQTQKFDDLMFI